MRYIAIVVAIFTSFAIAADGDVEYSAELSPDTYLQKAVKYETAQRETIEVIIGVQATGNYIPFWGSSYDACRFMTLYLQSEINVAGEIVTLSFMPSTGNTGTFDSVRVNLCHTDVTQLNTTFDVNYGGNTPVEVMNEPSLLVGNAGNVWMDWDVSFDYNNTDNLLVEILWDGDGGVGVPIWRTTESVPRRLYAWNDQATTGTVGNQCYYVKLAISTGPPPDHDAGVVSIDAPGLNLMPNTTLDPTATYRNFGTNEDTFDVYYEIDSAGVNIYNETANLIVPATTDTTISFASWTCGSGTGTTYDITAYTVLAGDVNPANDTLTQQTVVNPTFWEILPDIPVATSGHSESTVHDGYYLVTGFHTTTSYLPTIYEYDIANATWGTVTDNPYGCGAYGMAYGVLGNHYRICGTDGWPTGLTRVDIYDPVADTWSAGAAAPMANMDQIGGVYNDSLIFMFGGGNWGGQVNPHTNVYFYDVYSDAWTTATNFTGQGRGCLAGGVVGDYAIVACGYDGSNYLDSYIVGNIDPANPANITWGTATTIPGGFDGRYRVSSGVDYPATQAQEFWVTCGQGTVNPQCDDIWSYEPIGDVWTNWNMPKNQAVGNVNSVAITTTALDDIGVYVVGGYTGSYETDHECFHTGKIAVEEMPGQQDPSAVFGFAANMKNPSDGYSAITYTTTSPGKVSVKVYDGTGRLVKTLVNRSHEPAGTKTVFWNAKDDGSRTVANGIYFVRLEAQGRVDTHKMILVK